jgi:hypothetical protein
MALLNCVHGHEETISLQLAIISAMQFNNSAWDINCSASYSRLFLLECPESLTHAYQNKTEMSVILEAFTTDVPLVCKVPIMAYAIWTR